VSRQVSLDEKAVHQATAFLADDPDGLRAVLAAIDALSDNPYPDDAFPFGSTGLHRLRVGRYRVLYTAIATTTATAAGKRTSPRRSGPAGRRRLQVAVGLGHRLVLHAPSCSGREEEASSVRGPVERGGILGA